MAKFEVYKDSQGEFRIRLKANNGQVIATGESYTTKTGVLNGIESIKRNADRRSHHHRRRLIFPDSRTGGADRRT